MKKFVISIITMVIGGLIINVLSSDEKNINNQGIQIINNQQVISNSRNGSANSSIQNNQSININYSNKQ